MNTKMMFAVMAFFFSMAAQAEHDGTYCGKILDGKLGRSYGDQPEFILAIEGKINIKNKQYDPEEGFAAIDSETSQRKTFLKKAVKSSTERDTVFCIKGRWGGAAYSSWDIEDITLSTVYLDRADYLSAFEFEY